jgi:serpin B
MLSGQLKTSCKCYLFTPPKDDDFWISIGRAIKTKMMLCKGQFRFYYDRSGWDVIDLPFMGDDVSFVVIMPSQLDGHRIIGLQDGQSVHMKQGKAMGDIGTAITNHVWFSLLESVLSARLHQMEILLPKLRLRNEVNLMDSLRALGITDAFAEGRADFSGIGGSKDCRLSVLVHESVLDLDEEGVVGAAATVGVVGRSLPGIVRVNRPFIFVIRDNRSGVILFIGRVVDPTWL